MKFILLFLGMSCVVFGVGLMSVPIALITAGVMFLVLFIALLIAEGVTK